MNQPQDPRLNNLRPKGTPPPPTSAVDQGPEAVRAPGGTPSDSSPPTPPPSKSAGSRPSLASVRGKGREIAQNPAIQAIPGGDLVKGVDDLAAGVPTDGTAKGDIKSVAQATQSGAKVGAAFAGVGAPVGAALGGLAQAVRTKTGRRLMLAAALMPLVAIVAVFSLFMAMIMGISEADLVASNAVTAANTDGVSNEAITAIYEMSGNGPWELLGAIAYEYGNGQVSIEDSEDEVNPKKPTNPYGLVLAQAEKHLAKKQEHENTPYSMLLPISVDDARYFDAQTPFVSDLVTAALLEAVDQFVEDNPDGLLEGGRIPDLDAGATVTPNHEAGENEPSAARDVDQTDAAEQLSEESKEVYLEALESLDGVLDGVGDKAERIYNLAHMWKLGKPRCSTGFGSVSAVAGAWTHPLPGARKTSPFGMRVHPILRISRLHDGIDISLGGNAQVLAASSGVVDYVGNSGTGYGQHIYINHGNGVRTLYAHLVSGSPMVGVGDAVMPGQPIGIEGTTGYSSGVHLHFSVQINGQFTDPEPFMAQRGVFLAGSPAPDSAPVPTPPGTSGPGSGAELTTLTSVRSDGSKVTLNAEQIGNAADIVRTINTIPNTNKDVHVIALMTALQESSLRNLNHGDRDSLGLFQQRAGWGTAEQRQNVDYATRAFVGGPGKPSKPPGLLDIDYQRLSRGAAAQAVQVSAHPTAYDKWEPVAEQLYAALAGLSVVGLDANGCATGATPEGTLRVATYNVCLQWCDTSLKRPWRQRVGGVVDQIIQTSPDVIAMQEIGKKDIHEPVLTNEMKSAGYELAVSYSSRAIYYNPASVSPLDESGKPMESIQFTMAQYRHGVAMVMRDVRTGTTFLMSSLHPTAQLEYEAKRLNEVKVAERHIDALRRKNPGIITVYAGDFNTHFKAGTNRQLVRRYYHSRGYYSAEELTSNKINASYNSLNGQGKNPQQGINIDHVVVEKDSTPVTAWGLRHSLDMKNPDSDHNLVWADLSVGGQLDGDLESLASRPCTSRSKTTDGLTGAAIPLFQAVCAKYGALGGYHGLAPRGDHSTGRSLDIMVAGKQGLLIRDWLRANASALKIDYIIFEQRIWSVARSREGWRKMENRGSPTANHMDHIHVTVK